MKIIIRIVTAVLVAAFALTSFGCIHFGKEQTTPEPTQSAQLTQAVTEAPTAQPTEGPTEEPPEEPLDANAAFEELDLELFRELVTSSADSYNQYIVSNPAKFGIDPEDVERGWGGDYYTPNSNAEYMDACREVLAELENIDREELTDRNKYAYDAIKRHFESALLFEDYELYDEPLTPMNGLHTSLPLSLVCFNFRKAEDFETYVYLLEDMPRIINQLAQFEQDKADSGLFMTETALDQVLESLRGFAEKGEDCFLISYFDTVAEQAEELGLESESIAELRRRNDEAVLNGILPAYAALAATLEANREKCSEFVGASKVSEEARNYFDLSVQQESGCFDDIDTIINKVADMGDNIFAEMYYAVQSDPSVLDRYGEEITFGSIEDDMEWLEYFTELLYPAAPQHNVKYITIPDDIAEDFSPAAYLTPAFDDYYFNTILINPTADDDSRLLTLAHEGVPGHMYQFLYFRNMKGLSLSQQVLEPTGCAEGWTVFTEYFVAANCDDIGWQYCTMMNAESIYGNVFLPAYISLQVNHNRWTVSDVERFLNTSGMGEYADIFYEYAITMPTYAMSYAVGFAYMYDLYYDENPQDISSLKAYFEKLLSFGPTYLDLLAEYMAA